MEQVKKKNLNQNFTFFIFNTLHLIQVSRRGSLSHWKRIRSHDCGECGNTPQLGWISDCYVKRTPQ